MGFKFFRAAVKYVSRKRAIQRLDLTEKQFDRLTVLFGMYPVIAEGRNCYDKAEGWYYKIDDIRRIFYSETYEILKKNAKRESKREKLLKFKLLERAAKVLDEEFNLVDLVKQKYDSLGQSIDDLGNTLRNLFIIELLSIDDVKEDLVMFEQFIVERRLLNRAFMSKKGVYFGINLEKIIVCWMVPYPGVSLADLIEEKSERPVERPEVNIDFLDFGSLSTEEDEPEDGGDPDDPNKFDISLLKYAAPLLKIHLKLCLHKLNLLYPLESSRKPGLFKDVKFHINTKSIHRQISLMIQACGGQLVGLEEAKFVITETVDMIDPEKVYIQPQYIPDCINKSMVLSTDDYLVGKELPAHVTPFPNTVDAIDERTFKMLSNKKKYSILERAEVLN